ARPEFYPLSLHDALPIWGVAAVIGLLVVMSLLSVLARHRRQPAVRATVALTLTALAFQVAVGAAVVTLHLPAVLRGLHLALASRSEEHTSELQSPYDLVC